MDTKPKILLTGFAFFGSVEVNPSWQVTRAIRQDNIFHLCLPVDYEMAPRLLLREIRKIKPDWVIGSGIHFDDGFQLETIARQDGNVSVALQSPWPMERLGTITNIMAQIYPTTISNNAGAYVCENICYWISRLAKHYHYCGGFIHMPMLSMVSFSIQKKWWRAFLKELVK